MFADNGEYTKAAKYYLMAVEPALALCGGMLATCSRRCCCIRPNRDREKPQRPKTYYAPSVLVCKVMQDLCHQQLGPKLPALLRLEQPGRHVPRRLGCNPSAHAGCLESQLPILMGYLPSIMGYFGVNIIHTLYIYTHIICFSIHDTLYIM